MMCLCRLYGTLVSSYSVPYLREFHSVCYAQVSEFNKTNSDEREQLPGKNGTNGYHGCFNSMQGFGGSFIRLKLRVDFGFDASWMIAKTDIPRLVV